ncbi:hypothetical protein [Otoolea muris]
MPGMNFQTRSKELSRNKLAIQLV